MKKIRLRRAFLLKKLLLSKFDGAKKIGEKKRPCSASIGHRQSRISCRPLSDVGHREKNIEDYSGRD